MIDRAKLFPHDTTRHGFCISVFLALEVVHAPSLSGCFWLTRAVASATQFFFLFLFFFITIVRDTPTLSDNVATEEPVPFAESRRCVRSLPAHATALVLGAW